MNFCKTPLAVLGLVALSFGAQAQINMPAPSPGATLKQSVGMTEITIEYSRPSAKGRKVMGELVTYGDLWRVGANSATKLTTTDSITVAGKGLPKGSYIVMAKPGKDAWEIIFNKNLNASVFNRDQTAKDDFVTVMAKVETVSPKAETFTINIGNITNTSADIELIWENTVVRIPFTNDVDGKVMAQIKQKLDGPTQQEYFSMSQYYFDTNRDLNQALEFANKALAKGERFWMLRHKSLVQAKLGDKKGAIETAKRSLAQAKEANNMDYVRMNEKSIAEWSK